MVNTVINDGTGASSLHGASELPESSMDMGRLSTTTGRPRALGTALIKCEMTKNKRYLHLFYFTPHP